MFDEPLKLVLGLLTGIVFGFLLQKGRVSDHGVIVGQLLLRNWTVVIIMATAVVVGSVGVHAIAGADLASLHLKPLRYGGVVAGAVMFGIGMAVLGYCPGTGVAACGEGRRDAMVGVLGMLFGAGVFVAVAPALGPLIEGFGDRGAVSIPGLLGISPWAGVGVLVLLGGVGLVVRHRLERDRREGGLVEQEGQVVAARGGTPRP